MIGQPQTIIQKSVTILMRINRFMSTNPEGLKSNEALCNYLNIDDPNQEIIKHNFKFMHKMLQNKQPMDIIDRLKIPKRSCSRIYIKGSNYTQRSKRSPIFAGVELYNAMPASLKYLPHKQMKKKLKKVNINYSLFK